MRVLRNLTIREKLRVILMTVSTVAVVLACLAFIAFSMILWRQSVVRDLDSLAHVIANNCQAALAFDIPQDAEEVLSGLRGKQSVIAAAIYRADGSLFSVYPPGREGAVPPAPARNTGHEFGPRSLHLYRMIVLNEEPIGVLYLENDLGEAVYVLRRQAMAMLVVLALALVAAYVLSHPLERIVSRPILSLAETARVVAEEGDYTVRAAETGSDEVGLLTRALNRMLSVIAERDLAMRKEVAVRTRAENQLRELTATLEQRVAARTRALERSNRDLEHFAYVASHDLQEPLRTVSSYVQLLSARYGDKLDADAREFISYTVGAVDRMHNLIQGLLSYSRVGTKGQPFESTDCNAVLAAALANLKAALRDVDGDARITHDSLPTVWADAAQVTQVFQNLIGNSIKFRRDEVPLRVHVSAEATPDCSVVPAEMEGGVPEDEVTPAGHRVPGWVISVRDNGIGFDGQYASRAFVIFQRLHSRRKFDGAGIGLAFCKRIVERHGGRIWASAAEDNGSIFSFTLPESPASYGDEPE